MVNPIEILFLFNMELKVQSTKLTSILEWKTNNVIILFCAK